MKTKILTLLLIFTCALSAFSEETEKKEKTMLEVELATVLEVDSTTNIKAVFTDLSDKATEMGIEDIYISGKAKYRKNGNYSEVRIAWDKLENVKSLSKINFMPLKKTFFSKLTTDEAQILPPQKMTIEVDKVVLMQAVNALNEKNQVKPAEVKLDKQTVNALNKNQNGNNTSTGANAQQPLPQLNNLATVADDSVSITEVKCPIRYSIDDLRAYEQISLNTIDSNGNTQNVGACLDSGVTYNLSKIYGAPCTPLVSENNVYQSYRITGVVAGVDKIVRDCQVDLTDNLIAIQTTTDQCNYEHHLDLGLSYQTQRKFYELNGEIINISQCESNQVALQHKEAVCSYDLEVSPGFAVPQTRLYIELADNSESIVRDCSAHTSQIALIKQDCLGAERYLHDFDASVSYLQQETWVNNPFDNGAAVKLNECQISATTYTHLQQASNCARLFEDHNLLNRQAVKTFINDPTQTPSELFISDCSNGFFDTPYEVGAITLSADGLIKTRNYTRSDSTNYQTTEPTESKTFIYSADTSGNYTWTVPKGVTSIHATVRSGQGGGGGGSGSDGYGNYLAGNSGSNGTTSSLSTITALGGNGGTGGRSGTSSYGGGTSGGNGNYNTETLILPVNVGAVLSVTVGNGGNGGNGGNSSYENIRYGTGGGGLGGSGNGNGGSVAPDNPDADSAGFGGQGGAHGSVVIKY